MNEKDSNAIIERARIFCQEKIVPIAKQLDEQNRPPEELLEGIAAEGFFGSKYPVEYGGGGYDSATSEMVAMELAKGSAGVALLLLVQWMAVDVLLKYGSKEQKDKYLNDMIQGNKVAAYIISEPMAGSDASAMMATANSIDEGWVLNGNKYFCTNGGIADLYFVACKTEPEEGARGISMFIVEKDTKGLTVGHRFEKMGCRSSATTGLTFKDCIISHDSILGNKNQGYKIAMDGLTGGRLGMASMGLGIAQAAMDESIAYANSRIAFGKPLAKLYAVQEMVADMYVKLEAGRLLVIDAANKRDTGADYSLDTSVVKVFVADLVDEVCYKSLQIFGGHGYLKNNNLERYARDGRLMSIGVGASEVLKMVIGMTVMRKSKKQVQ